MSLERRMCARRMLYSPEYVDMGADNGGVIVNLSDGGLGFQAVGRVPVNSEVPLSFSLGPAYRIDVIARIVWVNAQGNAGGAVFGTLSKDSRSLIREWLSKPDVEHEETDAPMSYETEFVEAAHSIPTVLAEVGATPKILRLQSGFDGTSEEQFSESAVVPTDAPIAVPPADSGKVRTASAVLSPEGHVVETSTIIPPAAEARYDAGKETVGPVGDEARMTITLSGSNKPEKQSVGTPSPVAGKPQTSERSQKASSTASFSAAPSISAWAKKAPTLPHGTRAQTRGLGTLPVSTLRNNENIFARSQPGQLEYATRSRKGSGALIILAVVIGAAAIGTFYVRTHRQEVGDALRQIGNSIAGESKTPNTSARPKSKNPAVTPATEKTQANQPRNTSAEGASQAAIASAQTNPPRVSGTNVPPAVPAPANASGKRNVQTGASLGANTPASTSAPANGQPIPNTSKTVSPSAGHPTSAASGMTEYQRAEGFLKGKGVPQDSAQAAEWFWRSLELGNTDAAIPLADLYIAGDGVSRSCKQARILLDAAARKNNSEAILKLSQLPENCE